MKRLLFLSLLWALSAAACACVVGQMVASLCGHRLVWQHRAGMNLYVFGIDQGGIGVVRNTYRNVTPLPNETDVGGSGGALGTASFGVGDWHHVYKYHYFSPVPNDTYDPQKVSQYRKAVVLDAKMFSLDARLCALLLALLPAAVLLRAWRRFFLRRRALLGGHCRMCVYDLRATP